MDGGLFVEQGTAAEMFDRPREPRTRRFLNMIARTDDREADATGRM
jgi:ABC-type dipeptide/oligopeptide/nickel transport system ATPase component